MSIFSFIFLDLWRAPTQSWEAYCGSNPTWSQEQCGNANLNVLCLAGYGVLLCPQIQEGITVGQNQWRIGNSLSFTTQIPKNVSCFLALHSSLQSCPCSHWSPLSLCWRHAQLVLDKDSNLFSQKRKFVNISKTNITVPTIEDVRKLLAFAVSNNINL
jgi:hypothetical protein